MYFYMRVGICLINILLVIDLIPEQIHCITFAFTSAHACVSVDKALESKLKLLCGV